MAASQPGPVWIGLLTWNRSFRPGLEGNAHIAYQDYGNLKYASNSGGRWMVENLDSSERTGGFASLALDAKNNPHIAYSYSLSGGHYSRLKYISRSGGNWKVETVDGASASYTGWFAVHVGWFASLALDIYNNPRIAYYDATNFT